MLHYKDLKDKKNDFLLYTVMFVVSVAVLGFLIQMVIYGMSTLAKEGVFRYNFLLIFQLKTLTLSVMQNSLNSGSLAPA